MAKMMRGVVCPPQEEAYIAEIPNEYTYLRKIVDGPIECVYPFMDKGNGFGIGLVCNEEAKLRGKPLSREIRFEGTDYRDIIAGTFLIVGLTRENFGSLSPAQAEKYRQMFLNPEIFIRTEHTIIAVPVSASIRDEVEKIKAERPASAVNEQIKYAPRDMKPFRKG